MHLHDRDGGALASLVTVLGLGCCHCPGTVVVIKATANTRLYNLKFGIEV